MCPSNWKRKNQCPEPNNQPPVMGTDLQRNGGQWFTTDLEPVETRVDPKLREIMAVRTPGGNVIRSGLYHTCDEFPPKM